MPGCLFNGISAIGCVAPAYSETKHCYSETKHCGRCDAENKADGTGHLSLGIGFSLGLI